mgnify:CR=1 FL=1
MKIFTNFTKIIFDLERIRSTSRTTQNFSIFDFLKESFNNFDLIKTMYRIGNRDVSKS